MEITSSKKSNISNISNIHGKISKITDFFGVDNQCKVIRENKNFQKELKKEIFKTEAKFSVKFQE